jgi:signal transduction histidine kinase/CheY-like chemotaxis protein
MRSSRNYGKETGFLKGVLTKFKEVDDMKQPTLLALIQSLNEDFSVNCLVQSSPVCHKIFDPNFKLKFMSQAGIKALKIDNVEDYYDRSFPDESAPKCTQEIVKKYIARAALGETNTIEYSFEIDEKEIWFQTTIIPYFDNDKKLIYITADSVDITTAKHNEESNRILLETTDICLKEIHKNSDGSGYTLMFMSLAGQKQLGIDNIEALYGQPYPLSLHPENEKEPLLNALDQVVSTGDPIQIESKLLDTCGNSIWYLSTFSVQRRNESGEVISITGASQNITEKIQAQMILAKSKEDAEKANKAKSEFLSRMSHELRTPLNAILGFSQIMQLYPNQDINKRQTGVEHIIAAGNHLLHLVDEVLDLSKIEAGKYSIIEEHLNVGNIINKLLCQLQPFANKRSIKVINKLEQHEDIFIYADNTAFDQIMLNLLNNAIKYNKDAGTITIDGGTANSNKVWITVSDMGSGIGKENINELFEPFNRLGQEYGDIEGTGIGLSISKMLAELLGGTISVDCKPGRGCCFKVTFKKGISTLTANNVNAQGDSTNNNQSKNCKILYIEDNHHNLALVEQLLKTDPQVSFSSALNAEDGIEIARAEQPDLILMDIQLPKMDGICAFKNLQTYPETRSIPVIAVSAQAMENDIKKAMKEGFESYITKPIDVRYFMTQIERVLNNKLN